MPDRVPPFARTFVDPAKGSGFWAVPNLSREDIPKMDEMNGGVTMKCFTTPSLTAAARERERARRAAPDTSPSGVQCLSTSFNGVLKYVMNQNPMISDCRSVNRDGAP